MALLGQTRITRRRYDGGGWTAGRWTGAASSAATFKASVQKLSGRDRQMLDEGDRARETRKVITERVGFLRTTEQATQDLADEVLICGDAYRVMYVDPAHPLIRHQVAFVTKVQEAVAVVPTAGTLAAIEDGVRAWLVQQGASGGIPNDDRAVVIADEAGPRPPMPYLTINVILHDQRDKRDESYSDDATPPNTVFRGLRSATVSLNAFGADATAWMERAVLTLRSPLAQATLKTAGLQVEPIGGARHLTTPRDTDMEQRHQRDLAITYERISDAADLEPGLEVEILQHTDTLESPNPSDRVVVHTETLP